MVKRRVWPAILSFIAIILELLPTGVVMLHFPSDAEIVRTTWAYFNFASVWPSLTAIATCALFAFALVYLFNGTCRTAVGAVSAIACVCSVLTPLTRGLEFFSVTGIAISVVLAAATVLAFAVKDRKSTAATASAA